ncbi:hypothetical protein CBR_g8398 [Chara braunii]|uniref:Uncharacterized protein n=1 Tax=Chara braunii TaxID=69332 RepID=A0A388KM20_CHABU|nr:hypothetical protein CBR_g8398 [Chara braunii]|eukprot:GBG71099.1 hypothetical protein CBR_g8398 [Chara braunii]
MLSVCSVVFVSWIDADTMSTSRGEEQPTGTSGRESRTSKSWSYHVHAKWFVDWCCGDESQPPKPPCGPVIFLEDKNRRRVLGAVAGWHPAKKDNTQHYKLHTVYSSKGGVVANSKGAVLSFDLFQGFGARAVNTPFYQDLAVGGFVSAREFLDLVEQRNIDLEDPCDVHGDQQLSMPLQMCTGFESNGAPTEGGDLGSGPSSHFGRGESRGRFDDSDDEEQEQTQASPLRRGDRSGLSIPGVEGHTPVRDRPSTSTGGEDEGVHTPAHKRRGGPPEEGAGSTKKHKARTPQTTGGERNGVEGQESTSGRKRPMSVQKQPQPGALEAKGPIDVNVAYFLEWKDGVRTKREFFISPSQVVDIGEWEPSYNQRSLDLVHTQIIIDAMMTAFSQAEKTYELPTLKLAPLGMEKLKPGVRADRLKPEDWKDELADQYNYYAVSGQHNAAAAKSLLGSNVALRYNFDRWPAHMVYFSDEEFDGYFLVSSEDNMKDLKAPPRQLKLSMKDIRWFWKEKGFPKAVMGNPSGKQAQHVGAGHGIFREMGDAETSGTRGAKWITRKRKVKGVKPGVGHIENDKLGQKEVVYNVPVEAPQKKGKKEKEPGDWFVQVTEPDPHCWKSMESLTDNEKCRLLKKVLNCEVVWVQTGSASLAKQGKLGVQEAVHLLKCDRILVRLWNYYQFVHENRPTADWTRAYPFLKKRESILVAFEKQGMDASLWDGSRKLVGDASLFKDCPSYMGCEDDKTIKATEKLAQNKKLSTDWKNKVLLVLTGSRAKSMEVALAEGVVHVLWKDSGDVTSIASFGVDPLEAQLRVTELEKAVGTTKCHTCVLDLCEPVDFKQWTPKAFESLNSLLQQLFPSHWTVVAFVPRQWDYAFMTSLRHLPVVKAMAGKWVRRTQQKKSFSMGNNLYSADDCMYILFKGDDLRENTCVVYDARLLAGDVATIGVHQKVTPTDISETPFDPCEWPSAMPGVDRKVYKMDSERNPTQLAHLLEFVCKKGEGIMFLGKPHTRVVWEVLKSGRHVVALEGNSELLQYMLESLKSEVNSRASRCEFISRTEKSTHVREPSTDMWFKLSERKRKRIYEFLFLETRPRRDNHAEYMRRKEHMLALLDNYHDASRKNAKNFLDRLECLYFVESEQTLKLESYGSLISTEDEAETGIVFDTATPEEDSDSEDIDIDYHHGSLFHGSGSSSAGPATSPATQASPVLTITPGKTPSKLVARLTPRAAALPPLRPGSSVPLHHPSHKDDVVHFEGLDHTRSSKADWGHDMIWHPGTIQPAIQKGEWIMALIRDQGLWDPYPRQSKAEYLELARVSVLDKVRSSSGAGSAGGGVGGAAGGGIGVGVRGTPSGTAEGTTASGGVSPEQEATPREAGGVEGGENVAGKLTVGLPKGPASKSAGIRTTWSEAPGATTIVSEGGGTHLGVGERAAGFDVVFGELRESHGRDGGEEGEEGEEREEREEGEKGEEGEEGGEKGDIDIDDERLGNAEDAECEELSDSFEHLYVGHPGPDVDDDATTMDMETQVVSELSTDPEEYEVQPLTAAIDLQHLRTTTPGTGWGGFTAVAALGSLRILNDIDRGLVPPTTVLSTLGDGQLRIAAKDLVTFSLINGRVNDEVVNF